MGLRKSFKRLKNGESSADINRRGQSPSPIETTLFISNLHCPSCVSTIEQALFDLSPRPLRVSASIVSHSVVVAHYSTLDVHLISQALEDSGFEIHSIFQQDSEGRSRPIQPSTISEEEWQDSLEQSVNRWRQSWWPAKDKDEDSWAIEEAMDKRARHAEQCPECQLELTTGASHGARPYGELSPKQTRDSARDRSSESSTRGTDSKLVHVTTAAQDVDKGLLDSPGHSKEESFSIAIDPVGSLKTYRAEFAITGMTCSSCVGNITRAVEGLAGIRSVQVSLLTNSAVVLFEGKGHADRIVGAIEDAGYDATLEAVEELTGDESSSSQTQSGPDTWKATYTIGGMTCSSCVGSITKAVKQYDCVQSVDINLISNSGTVIFHGEENLATLTEAIENVGYDANLDHIEEVAHESDKRSTERTVSIKVDGMYCHHCPAKVLSALDEEWLGKVKIEQALTLEEPILRIRYIANPPNLNIRSILATISKVDSAFEPKIHHPPTMEDKSRALHERERRRILFRLALSVIAAIPAFLIGIVFMSLLSSDNSIRKFMMAPMWAGTVSRAQWALLIIATPIYFFAADTFHRKAIKELKALWRPGSRTPIIQRFYRFGSMNMLMSLGTSIAYISSIAELILAATYKAAPGDKNTMADNNSFYFDSVVFLTMFLLIGRFLEAYSKAKTGDAVTQLGKLRPTEALLLEPENHTKKTVPVDMLDVGDIVAVPHGSSPPFDGTISEGETSFDESSLTGESRLVRKTIGDAVYSGTVNKGASIHIRLSSVQGTSMLDQIIKVVREGQTRRAPVERAADLITSHFVPFVVLIGILTWVIWLALGESGALPKEWLDTSMGGWLLWSLRFSIAVFVIACPCGIGLAAPTALFVGGGMAAQHGILVKGGGEAFQEASNLDCIVFDKTGTLTEGGEPRVTDFEMCSDDVESEILGMVMSLEQESNHPIARAIINFCNEKQAEALKVTDVEELPGRGMKGAFTLDHGTEQSITANVLVGNERLMTENEINVEAAIGSKLQTWKQQGKSVVLVAIRAWNTTSSNTEDDDSPKEPWTLSAMFAVADALRPEASQTITALRSRGISAWMLSGDNSTTAQAVALQVGIHPDNVIAGVLPDQKADKIQYLQRTLPYKGRGKKHATVAMVGDGINDSPALTMADVGIAIGSGSDVAISSADFILISSELTSLLTLIDLSRAVFRRVWFNFGWALVYNVVAMPVAAGVLYPIKTGNGGHVRLDPVWASLAMAMSSVSVVSSSLLLRSKLPVVGFSGVRVGETK